MRSRSMFHTCTAFILTVLIFSISSGTRAQQHAAQTEVPEIAAAQDIKSVNLAAKAAAERDANRDVNQLVWFGTGIGVAAIGAGVGALSGCGVGSLLNPEMVDPYGVICILPIPNREQAVGAVVGTFVGALIGGSASFIRAYNYSSNPPTERFIGKSPEYVDFYTEAYTQKTRSIRTRLAAAGAAIGCGLALLFVVGG